MCASGCTIGSPAAASGASRFIVDDYCAETRVCLEIDGDGHAEPAEAQYDAARTETMEAHGVRAICFTNHEVRHNLLGVLETFEQVCSEAPRSISTPIGPAHSQALTTRMHRLLVRNYPLFTLRWLQLADGPLSWEYPGGVP